MEVVSLFESFDPKLTALLDVMHQNTRGLLLLDQSNHVYRATPIDIVAKASDTPPINHHIFYQCFAIHEALQHGIALVDYSTTFESHVASKMLVKGCRKFLETVGEYKPN